jgi:hypothetical protein
MRGHDLYDAHYRRIATVRGLALCDGDNKTVATIQGDELHDTDDRIIATFRGSDIYDSTNTKVGSISDVQESIQGAAEGMIYVAMWYCFVR